MIRSFRNDTAEDLFDGRDTRAARRIPRRVWAAARRRLDQLDAANDIKDLGAVPGNHLHKLNRPREGQHAIRINDQYRICFTWTKEGPANVEVTDYH